MITSLRICKVALKHQFLQTLLYVGWGNKPVVNDEVCRYDMSIFNFQSQDIWSIQPIHLCRYKKYKTANGPHLKWTVVGYPLTSYFELNPRILLPSIAPSLAVRDCSSRIAAALENSGLNFLQWPHPENKASIVKEYQPRLHPMTHTRCVKHDQYFFIVCYELRERVFGKKIDFGGWSEPRIVLCLRLLLYKSWSWKINITITVLTTTTNWMCT